MSATTNSVRAGQAAHVHRFGRELPPRLLGVVMNLPTLVTLALVLAYPIYYAAYLSMHKVTLVQLRTGVFPFVGFDNYLKVLDDPLFLLSLTNTLLFTAFTVVSEVVLAVAIAILINQQDIWTSRITRFLILLPYAVPPIANGLIWSFIYNGKLGFLNRLLYSVGIIDGPIDWTANADTALYAVAVPYIWRTLPFAILLVHAALQGINKELFEAASVDGAGAWHRFRYITWPSMSTLYVTCTLLSMIFTVGDFNSVYLLTGGGPADLTHVLATLGIRYLRLDQVGLAMASIVCALPLILPLVYFMMRRLSR